MIGLIATPELLEFCVSAIVTNYKMNFFPVAQLPIPLKKLSCLVCAYFHCISMNAGVQLIHIKM